MAIVYSGVVISIHALLAESDRTRSAARATFTRFLSTLSLRRATLRSCPASSRRRYFYPRSPCGERQDIYIIWECMSKFLSTLSLRRATQDVWSPQACACDFYPRSPCGERPGAVFCFFFLVFISIHALLAESDC